jgi:hypothetical protein
MLVEQGPEDRHRQKHLCQGTAFGISELLGLFGLKHTVATASSALTSATTSFPYLGVALSSQCPSPVGDEGKAIPR